MARRLASLATCNLDQWAMDFEGNLKRVEASIRVAKEQGARYRVGPELELCGYGCEDHFYELDTATHCWEALAELLRGDLTVDMLCDVGMPVFHRGVLYNCRVLLLNKRILLIRPKLALANDGNYRETRYFASWKQPGVVEDHILPPYVSSATCDCSQVSAPFGDGVLRLRDTTLAAETCEELFTPAAPHIDLALAGVEIVSNGSGSHHQLRKLDTRLDLIRSATAKAGGVYLYANQRGCDGGRLYFDGCASVIVNGQLVAQGSQFSLSDVEVVTAVVDLDQVVSYRGAIASLREQASQRKAPHFIDVSHWALCAAAPEQSATAAAAVPGPTPAIGARVCAPEEEIAYGPACWLWDYLRRSGASGFLLPLSGGADSSSTAAIVGAMCQMVCRAVSEGDQQVLQDVTRIAQYKEGEEIAKSPQVEAVVTLFVTVCGKRPMFKADGGSNAENLALQNIQARLRMVIAFLFAQLTPWVRGRTGWLLVLGSANVDEALRGYLTKYDCSSADINPTGGISKQDLRRFLRWASVHLGYPSLADVEAAPPTAELEPLREGIKPQNDEDDMGMTYEELSLYGRLRKVERCGPVSMFWRILDTYTKLTASQVAAKVKHFFTYYSINRHKTTVLTPSYHAESYSPDDNRFDHRQFLYNVRWPWQFKRIDAAAAQRDKTTATNGA